MALREHVLPDGAAMVHLRRGPADGVPAVLVPGLSDGLSPLWSDAGQALVGASVPPRLRHLAGLLVSHRRPLGAHARVEALAEDLVELLAAVAGAPAVLSGHSLGGVVALEAAARAPGLVAAVVATGCGLRATSALDERLRHWEELLLGGDHEGFAADAVEVASTGSELLRRRLALRLLGARVDPDLVARHVALSRAARAHDLRGTAPEVACPVLVVGATRDPLVPVAQVEALAAATGGRAVLLDGLAHGFPEQAPRRVADLVADFLDEALTRSARPLPAPADGGGGRPALA